MFKYNSFLFQKILYLIGYFMKMFIKNIKIFYHYLVDFLLVDGIMNLKKETI